MKNLKSMKKGFTLMETLIVLGIAVIFAGAIIAIYLMIRGQATASAEADKMRSFVLSIENYAQDAGVYPAITCDSTTWNTDNTCLKMKAYVRDLANQGYVYSCTAGGNPVVTSPTLDADVATQVANKVDKLQNWTCTVNTNNKVECTNNVYTCS